MNKKLNILLTGATGFFGSHLLPGLIENGHKVIILKRSFDSTWKIEEMVSMVRGYDLDTINLDAVFRENKIDAIIHLATDYGKDVQDSQDRVARIINANVEFPSRLMELAVHHGIGYFINTHSASESKYLFYSAAKNAFLEIADFYSANYDLKFVNMVIEYMYGERDDDIKFIPSVISKIFCGEEIKASGGEQERDFIYVGDVAKAYLTLLNQLDKIKENFTEFHIGTGSAISFKVFVKKLEEIVGNKARICWGALNYRKNELFYSKADVSHINKILGWKSEVSLEQGLSDTIRWYRKRQENISGVRFNL